MAMAPPIQDVTHAHLNEQTKTNMSAIAYIFTAALKVLREDRNKHVEKILQHLMTEIMQYFGFGGPWVSAVLALVFLHIWRHLPI